MKILKQSIFIFLLGILCFNLHAATDTTPLLDEGGRPPQVSMVAVSVFVSETTGEKECNAALEYLRTKGLDENTTDRNYFLNRDDLHTIFTPLIKEIPSFQTTGKTYHLPSLMMLERVLFVFSSKSFSDGDICLSRLPAASPHQICCCGEEREYNDVAKINLLKTLLNREKLIKYLLSRSDLPASKNLIYQKTLGKIEPYTNKLVDLIRTEDTAPAWPTIVCYPCCIWSLYCCGKCYPIPGSASYQESSESIRARSTGAATNSWG